MRCAKLLLLSLFTVTAMAQVQAQTTTVTKSAFGKLPSGEQVDSYTLTSPQLTVKLITFGARVTSILAPDRSGKPGEVVLGYDNLDGYLADKSTYFGSIVGRYGNRIAKGTFSLDGKQYHLPINNGSNTLHGGTTGFDRANWSARQLPRGVAFTLVSKDGDQGFPGTLTVHVNYELTGSALHISYSATTDKDTVLNLTNHTYFNLSGSGDILGDLLTLNADRYTPVDSGLIPTGQLAPVEGTPFDFRTAHVIGQRIDSTNEQLKLAGGYDHNFVITGPASAALRLAAKVADPKSGRILTVQTTEPGVQFYAGNFLDGNFHGHGGTQYTRRTGFCLETQHYPDSLNHPSFPTTELKPGQIFQSPHRLQLRRRKVAMQRCAVFTIAALLIAGTMTLRAQSSNPILLELFTSEGCSSCPPADDLLKEFNGKRAASGAEIVAISEHVTYWNQLGWSDPFSAQIYTTRQSSYAERFHLRDIYTPQMVMNGAQEFVGSDRDALLKALHAPAARSPLLIHINSAILTGNALDLNYTVSGAVPEKGIEVAVVLAADVTGSKVTAGENSGQTLSHVSVARAIAHFATLHATAQQQSFHLQLPSSAIAGGAPHRRIILFAQEFDLGKVLSVDAKPL